MRSFVVLGLLGLAACGDNSARATGRDAAQGVADGAPDAPAVDAPPADAMSPDAIVADAGPPDTLAGTGLCVDAACTQIAPGILAYTPRWALWADAASKRRWIYLPPGSQIDTSDMNTWHFPQGTKLWKEFTSGATRVETRFFWKQGADDTTWFEVAYVWNAAQNEAVATPLGETDALGTQHDVPARSDCLQCHYRVAGRILGFSALQLDAPAASGQVDLDYLVKNDLLTDPPAAPSSGPYFPLWPDASAADSAALGYLHANCGHCHNATSDVYDICPRIFKLDVTQLGSVHDTDTYNTTIGKVPSITVPGGNYVVDPGDTTDSEMYIRFTSTDETIRMPPLATKVIDPTGQQTLHDWIVAIPTQ